MSEFSLLNEQAMGEKGNTRIDGLGFKNYKKILGDAALGMPGPFTIGIFGEWGEGKTSLMMLIKDYVSQEDGSIRDNVIPVWFNAWQFEKEEHPLIPLIATIVKAIEERESLLTQASKIFSGKSLVRALRAIAYGFSVKSKIKLPGFAEVEASFVAKDLIEREKELSRREGASLDPLLDRSLYYNAFEILSNVKLDSNLRIIIFIDDLDRCFPDQAIKLLESMKLIFSQPGFIFFLGVSKKVIEGYLQYRYKKEYGIENFKGQDYFHKIVQLPFEIPSHHGRMETFCRNLMNSFDERNKRDFGDIMPLVGFVSKNNPRSAIRFLNNLFIDRAIESGLTKLENEEDIPIGFFAITRGLQISWPDMYELLEKSSQELCTKIADWKSYPIPSEKVDENNSSEVQAALMINTERNLPELIFSEYGLQWLKNETLRDAAIRFLRTQRPDIFTDKRYDVLFIYADDSIKEISQIAGILKENTLRVFADIPTEPDKQLPDKVEASIKEARVFVFCISPAWKNPAWKKTALEIVLKARDSIQIITLYLPGAKMEDVPKFLSDRARMGTDFREQPINETTLKPFIESLLK